MKAGGLVLRAIASVGAVALVASIPAWTLSNLGTPVVADRPDTAPETAWGPAESSPTPTDSEGSVAEPSTPVDGVETSGSAPVVSSAPFNGTSGWIDFNGGKLWIGPPGDRSEVWAAVTAYRAGLGLPAFVPYDSVIGWSCSPAAHGSATATDPSGASLGQLLLARSSSAAAFRPTAGWAATASVVVDELIIDGVVYPRRATQLLVQHCSPPPGSPSPAPAEPSAPPADPPPSDPPPSDPPPADPPADPAPAESPV